MFGYLDFLFLSYAGRIGRLNYWLGSIVLLVLQAVVCIGLFRLAGDVFGGLDPNADTIPPGVIEDFVWRVIVPIAIVSVLFLYPTYALATKRWHDRNKSGWWSLIAFVPFIGGLWFLIECGFLGGTDGENYYGPAPGSY